MPRIRLEAPEPKPKRQDLVDRLVQELRSGREFGQPTIREESLPHTALLRVTVIWDAWDSISYEERYLIVQRAYERVEGADVVNRMPMVTALTVPEAIDEGLMPYQIVTLLRKGDPVTYEQCREVMIQQGGSILRNPHVVELRFATLDEAEKCLERLKKALPGSDDVWGITFAAASHVEQISHVND